MKNNLKNNQGMTMVEVLMGFVLLTLMLGMLSQVIAFSSNLYRQSVSMKRAEENLEKNIYKKNLPLSDGTSVTVKEVKKENGQIVSITDATFEKNGSKTNLVTGSKVYTLISSDFPDAESSPDDPQIAVTIFRSSI